MVTKGYNSYHGRMSGGKIVLIVVLALVLVGAVKMSDRLVRELMGLG